MKKVYIFVTAAIIFSFSYTNAQIISGTQAKLVVNSAESVALISDEYLPSFMKFSQGEEIDLSSLQSWLVENFKLSNGFGLKLIRSEKDKFGYTHYRYQQTIYGYPVLGGDYVAHVYNNKIISVTGKIEKNIKPDINSLLTENEAVQKALSYINAIQYKWQVPEEEALIKQINNDPKATYFPKGEFFIVPENGKVGSQKYRLALRFDIYAHNPVKREYVFVDAINGEILLSLDRLHIANTTATADTKYSGSRSIITDYTGSTYRLRETGRGNGIETYDMNTGTNYGSAVDFTNATTTWTGTNASQDEVARDAHWGTEQTWDYYYDTFGRNSVDNAGLKLISYVHFDVNYVNAFWDGTRMTYGDGNATYSPLTTIDICAHEVTHGVTENTASLIYQDESGALNEGFSDIFATCTEFYAKPPQTPNWTIGEEIGSAFRSMSNPNAYSQPDTYLGNYWYSGTADNGGVHTNSGVLNYWFYLLSQGGSGTNDLGNSYNVTGITMAKAEQIAYRTLTHYLTASSSYADARTYSILACQDLYGGCSQEAHSTTDAWYAVGVGAAYTTSATTADFSACPVTQCSNAPFTVQFENLSANANTFTWYFGDGSTSTTAAPSHTYNTNGSYNVKLVALGGTCGSDSITKNAFITVGPTYECVASVPASGTGTTQTSCTGTLYDSGVCGNYTNSTDGRITIAPTGATSVTLTFTSFSYENAYDFLYIYDGPTTASPQVSGSPFSGSTLPGVITSSGGSVTIRQTSDAGVVTFGFSLEWTCAGLSAPPAANFSADKTSSCSGTINFTDLSSNGPTSWLWDFGDGQTSPSQNPSHIYTASGTFTVTLTATNTYGNDQEIKTSYITISMPNAPSTTGATRCGTGSVTLSAGGGTGTLLWYNAPIGGNIVNTGTSYSTPSLATTTNYYVLDSVPGATTGCAKPDNSGGGGYTSSGDHYLIFNSAVPVKLVSVKIYGNPSSAPGNRTIELRNSSGTVLQSASVNILSNTNTITLNFDIPAANGLRLACEGTNIYRNNSGVTYPYSTPGYISVTGSDAGANFYYYFYDWQILTTSCISARTQVTASIDPAVAASVNVVSDHSGAICSGTNVTFTATPTNGGTTPVYQWKLNGGNVGTNSTTYSDTSLADGDIITCVMTSNESCVTGSPYTSNAITITVNSNVAAGVSISDNPSGVVCQGTNVIFTAVPANGGVTPDFEWYVNGIDYGSDSSIFSSTSLDSGDVITCIMTSSDICASNNPDTSNSIIFSAIPATVANAGTDQTICIGDSALLIASGGDTYLWSNGYTDASVQVNPAVTTTYIVTATIGSCAASDEITVNVLSAPVADAGTDQTICEGDTAILSASGGGAYLWSNGDTASVTNAIPAINTTYTLTSSIGSCISSDDIMITVNPLPLVNAGSDITICNGDSVALTATGGTTYEWSNSMSGSLINVAPSITTTYVVTVSENMCSDTDDITVNVNPEAIADAGSDQVICKGSSATLTASGGSIYLWNNGDVSSSIIVSPETTSSYTVTVSNGNCSATDNVAVSVNLPPNADFTVNNLTIAQNGNIIFTDYSIGAAEWLWIFGDGSTSIWQNTNHTYTDVGFFDVILIVTSSEGCKDTIIKADLINVFDYGDFYIPSCFSPNFNGENDLLFVRGTYLDNIVFKVYDQWGVLVFETNNSETGWDGTYKGEPLPIGNYIYSVKVIKPDGEIINKDGVVSLVR